MERTLAYPQIFCAGVNNIITIMPRKRKPGTEIGLGHSLIFLSKRLLRNLHYFPVRSSRSSAMRYGLPSWMSVKTSYGAGGGLGFLAPPALELHV